MKHESHCNNPNGGNGTFFTLLGSTSVKAVRRTLMKLSPDRTVRRS